TPRTRSVAFLANSSAPLSCPSLSLLECNAEDPRITVPRRSDGKDELASIPAINPVRGIADVACTLGGVRRIRVDAICHRIVEIDLRRELASPCRQRRRADLEVDVNSSPRVPAR